MIWSSLLFESIISATSSTDAISLHLSPNKSVTSGPRLRQQFSFCHIFTSYSICQVWWFIGQLALRCNSCVDTVHIFWGVCLFISPICLLLNFSYLTLPFLLLCHSIVLSNSSWAFWNWPSDSCLSVCLASLGLSGSCTNVSPSFFLFLHPPPLCPIQLF